MLVFQKQYKSDGSNFHVGWIHGTGKPFVWVYDCGDKKAAEQFDTPIDVIFVSHFHKDHIAGIKTLKDKACNDKTKIVIPYMTEFEFLTQYESATSVQSDYTDFLQEVAIELYVNRGSERFIVVRHNDEDDLFRTILGECPHFWILKTHYYQSNEDNEQTNLVEEILTKLNIKTIPEIFDKIKTNEELKKLKQVYEECTEQYFKNISLKDDKNCENRTSLSLYAGPTKDCHLSFGRAGWLHTGDSCLKNDKIYSQFYTTFKDYEKFIGTVVLPHHGSENNNNPKLYRDFHAECFVVPYFHKVVEGDYSFMSEKLSNTKNGDVLTRSGLCFCTQWNYPRVEFVRKCFESNCCCRRRYL